MKNSRRSLCVGLFGFILMLMSPQLLSMQQSQRQVEQNDYEELEKFLPSTSETDDDAQMLIMIHCTTCHSAKATKERMAQRVGGDITFWTTLVRRMNSTWNASIPEEDIDEIVAYLARHLGPSSKQGSEQESERSR